jgi:hypothetical protein
MPNDVDYEYRQENNLYYLTNLKQKGATLVLVPSNEVTPEILFLPDGSARRPGPGTCIPRRSESNSASEIGEANEFELSSALRNRQPYRPKADKIQMSPSVALPKWFALGFEKLPAAAGRVTARSTGAGCRRQFGIQAGATLCFGWAKSASGYSIRMFRRSCGETTEVAAGDRPDAARH